MLYPKIDCCRRCRTLGVGRARNMSNLCDFCGFRTRSFGGLLWDNGDTLQSLFLYANYAMMCLSRVKELFS